MELEEYIAEIERREKITLDPEKKEKMIKAMEKYGDNHWWEFDVPDEVAAYYQLREDIILINPKRFMEGLSLLLGRGVWDFEIYLRKEELLKETEEAMENLREDVDFDYNKEIKSIKSLIDFCVKKGINLRFEIEWRK